MGAFNIDDVILEATEDDVVHKLVYLNFLAEFLHMPLMSDENVAKGYKVLQASFTPEFVQMILNREDNVLNKRLSDTFNLVTYLEGSRVGSMVNNPDKSKKLWSILAQDPLNIQERNTYGIKYFKDFEKDHQINIPHYGGYTTMIRS